MWERVRIGENGASMGWRAMGRGRGGWPGLGAALVLTALALGVALAGCGQTFTSNLRPLPAGTYTSATYHFKIAYPSGWGYTVLSCGSDQQGGSSCDSLHGTSATSGATPIPLQLTITREGVLTTGAPAVSALTLSVLDMSDSYVAAAAAGLAGDTSLHQVPLAGTTAYVSAAVQQAIPGSNGTPSATSDTHTDYYLVHGAYEYQISVDALSGDGSTDVLQAMVRSFAFTT